MNPWKHSLGSCAVSGFSIFLLVHRKTYEVSNQSDPWTWVHTDISYLIKRLSKITWSENIISLHSKNSQDAEKDAKSAPKISQPTWWCCTTTSSFSDLSYYMCHIPLSRLTDHCDAILCWKITSSPSCTDMSRLWLLQIFYSTAWVLRRVLYCTFAVP